MSELEDEMSFHIKACKLPSPEREYEFSKKRKWKFDFCWPGKMIALEVEGGIWAKGRHSRGVGFTNDCEKYNTALLNGWRVLRVTGDQVKSGLAIKWLEEALQSSFDH